MSVLYIGYEKYVLNDRLQLGKYKYHINSSHIVCCHDLHFNIRYIAYVFPNNSTYQ